MGREGSLTGQHEATPTRTRAVVDGGQRTTTSRANESRQPSETKTGREGRARAVTFKRRR